MGSRDEIGFIKIPCKNFFSVLFQPAGSRTICIDWILEKEQKMGTKGSLFEEPDFFRETTWSHIRFGSMIFPLHDREELNLLCKSKRNGARDPIIIHVKLMPSDAPGPDRPIQQKPKASMQSLANGSKFGCCKINFWFDQKRVDGMKLFQASTYVPASIWVAF